MCGNSQNPVYRPYLKMFLAYFTLRPKALRYGISWILIPLQCFYEIFSGFSSFKVHIFWEGHKVLRNLHQLFDGQYIGQIIGGDIAKFCGLLRMYELWLLTLRCWISVLHPYQFSSTTHLMCTTYHGSNQMHLHAFCYFSLLTRLFGLHAYLAA